jgi:hypothetical protein
MSSTFSEAGAGLELKEAFMATWLVIRPRGTRIGSRRETQLRLALARYLAQLSSHGVTVTRELRRQAIEHFLLGDGLS